MRRNVRDPLARDPLGSPAAGAILAAEVAEFLRAQPTGPGPGDDDRGGVPARRMLVPYSGSRAADRAIDAVTNLAPGRVSEVRVVHVREFEVSRGGPLFVETRTDARALNRAAVAHLRQCGVPATGVVRDAQRSDVATTILDEADRLRANVIVVGARRRPALLRLLARSVSRAIVRQAHCPVLLIPSDHRRMALSRRPDDGRPGPGWRRGA